jgi:hypothetical protein
VCELLQGIDLVLLEFEMVGLTFGGLTGLLHLEHAAID